jgi:hypothetical protein
MSLQELTAVLLCTAGICIPALFWILREARADTSTFTDDDEVLY